jgi:hypothetical protein
MIMKIVRLIIITPKGNKSSEYIICCVLRTSGLVTFIRSRVPRHTAVKSYHTNKVNQYSKPACLPQSLAHTEKLGLGDLVVRNE